MPKSVNRVTLMGYLGKDPEIRGDQTPRASFTLATTEWVKLSKTHGDEFSEHTTWHRIQVLGRAVEKVKSLQKGDFIYLEGRLDAYNYEDEQGRKQSLIYVKAWEIIPCIAQKKQSQQTSRQTNYENGEVPF